MTSDAGRFHTDAVHARAAIVAQKASTAKGQQARRLALIAFSDYALAGTKWAASGRARLAHNRSASIAGANAGATYAHTADKLLLTAGNSSARCSVGRGLNDCSLTVFGDRSDLEKLADASHHVA